MRPDGAVEVRIEAKFGAQLGLAQIQDYLHVADGARLVPVVILHPADRQQEINRRIAEVLHLEPQSVVVSLTWERLTGLLVEGLDQGFARNDVEQLRSLANAAEALDIPPFPKGLAGTALNERIEDLRILAEAASRFANDRGRLWPYRNLTPGLEPGRYFALGDGLPNPAVGVRVGWVDHSPAQPLWLRFHKLTRGFAAVITDWEARDDRLGGDREDGHLFIPLELPHEISGEGTIGILQAQVADLCDQLLGVRPVLVGVDDERPTSVETTEPV